MNTLDLTQSSSYSPAFISANGRTIATAEAALLAALAAGVAYLNIPYEPLFSPVRFGAF
jgi:hypothetical protein